GEAFDRAAWPLGALCLPEVLRRQASLRGEQPFLTELASGRRWNYREIDAWSSRVANALAARGVTRGQHVGVLMGNSAEHLAVFFALGKLGAVSVPVNTAARGELLRYYLSQS